MVKYQKAVFASKVWAARRELTGEYIEFNPHVDSSCEWTYTDTSGPVQIHFERLADWADWMGWWDRKDGTIVHIPWEEGWEPLTPRDS